MRKAHHTLYSYIFFLLSVKWCGVKIDVIEMEISITKGRHAFSILFGVNMSALFEFPVLSTTFIIDVM